MTTVKTVGIRDVGNWQHRERTMRELINAVPFWWLITGSILCFMLLSYFAAQISVFFFTPPVSKEHRDLSNTLISILSGGFSILLAFVIINTWNYFLSARNVASKEANYLAIIARDSFVLPPEVRDSFIEGVREYVVAVRVDEWKTMRDGLASLKAWDALANLYMIIQNYHPKTKQQDYFYSQILRNTNALLEARRERLNDLQSVIPEPLKQALLVGSLFLAVILGGIRGEGGLLAIAPVLLFSGILGFNIGVALSFDYPFSGDVAVSKEFFYSGGLKRFSD